MRIILSPTKKMRVDADTLAPTTRPALLDRSREILAWMRERSPEDLQSLWGCNDEIAQQNIERLKEMDLDHLDTPALLAYEGIAFQYMAPDVFSDDEFRYVQNHLRILSAFFGVLRPLDGVSPYRLEMQAKATVAGSKDLYEFWGNALYEQVHDESGIIVNLASKEYSKCVERYLQPNDHFITIDFREQSNGRLVTKATYAKMARGHMVRYMAEHRIEDPEQLKSFDRMGYVFREDLSDERYLLFERMP